MECGKAAGVTGRQSAIVSEVGFLHGKRAETGGGRPPDCVAPPIDYVACGKRAPLDTATKQALVAHKDALCACTQSGGPACAAELERTSPAPRVSAEGLSEDDLAFIAEIQAFERECRGTLADLAQFTVDVERAAAEREQLNSSLGAIDQLHREGALGGKKAAKPVDRGD